MVHLFKKYDFLWQKKFIPCWSIFASMFYKHWKFQPYLETYVYFNVTSIDIHILVICLEWSPSMRGCTVLLIWRNLTLRVPQPPRAPPPIFPHPLGKEFFLIPGQNFPCSDFCQLLLSCFCALLRKTWLCLVCSLLRVFLDSNKSPHPLGLFKAEESQFPQPLLTCYLLQSLLDARQEVNVLLVL